jgi:hypothetical protein
VHLCPNGRILSHACPYLLPLAENGGKRHMPHGRQNVTSHDTGTKASIGSTLADAWAKMPHGDNGLSIPGCRGEQHSPAVEPASPPERTRHGIVLAAGHNRGPAARNARFRQCGLHGLSQNGMKNAHEDVMAVFDLDSSLRARYVAGSFHV